MGICLPSAEPVARFRRDLIALVPEPVPLGIAVSGGPDSMALLLLAAAVFPGRIEAATVDHNLRPESRSEAEWVAEVCRSIRVMHSILPVRIDPHRSSLQRAAREARYAALGSWMNDRALGLLATAHHADDQAETLMMRLLRGAGVKGLSSVRPLGRIPGHPALRLARPLLAWRRAELGAIAGECGLEPVRDPSNEDERYDRVRIRSKLRESVWIDIPALARSAGALAEADEALCWASDRLAADRIACDGDRVTLDPDGVPAELRRRLIVLAMTSAKGSPIDARGDEIGRLLEALDGGKQGNLAGVMCRGGAVWTFEKEAPRRAR